MAEVNQMMRIRKDIVKQEELQAMLKEEMLSYKGGAIRREIEKDFKRARNTRRDLIKQLKRVMKKAKEKASN